MIKKNLIILLLIPFLIALIGAAAIRTTYKIIDNDITDIKWKYGDVEAFKVRNSFLLEAESISTGDVGEDNELIWTVENKDKDDDVVHAKIRKDNDKFYLDTLVVGNIILTCSNKKGNIYRSMNAIVYEHGAILVSSEIQSSQQNIDNTIYYGEYDLVDGQKRKATFNLKVKVVPEQYENNLQVADTSSNINFNLQDKVVEINDIGDAHITISCPGTLGHIDEQSYSFNVVKNGINVYDYETLLACTNKSNNGEIVVLRKSFESLENYTNSSLNNVELFGNYDQKTKKFNFSNEIYNFTTTYNHEFIDKWNANCDNVAGETKISSLVKAGLHIQKDLYGNGYTINMHNLTYPSGTSKIQLDDGTYIEVPTLLESDLYRGPLPFYSLGNHNNMPLIEAFGQDNVGIYVDGNNITVNDINMKNCDFANSLSFLDYVGTVMDIYGDNNTIINSRVSNGKNVVRAFSTNNLEIKNTLLSNARNFLLYAGSNEYTKPNESKQYEFTLANGSKVTTTISEFFKKGGDGDTLLTNYCTGSFTNWAQMYQALQSCQNALCDASGLYDADNNLIYKGKIDVTDTFFYRSGVSSIGLDTMFDGAYLYSSIPSVVNTYLSKLDTQAGNKLSELLTNNTAGQAYPIELNINGKTRFYDYKETDNIDISGLIHENIKSFASAAAEAMGYDPEVISKIDMGIDKIFPIKDAIIAAADKQGSIYKNNENDYVNCIIAFYGGGFNYSSIKVEGSEIENNINKEMKIDLLTDYLKLPESDSSITQVKYLMMKAVTATVGTSPFKFICLKDNGYLFGESPNVRELRNN